MIYSLLILYIVDEETGNYFLNQVWLSLAAVNNFNQEWNWIILDTKYTSVLGLLVTLKSFFFNGLMAVTGHLYRICISFIMNNECIIFLFALYFEFVCYINQMFYVVSVRYIYSNLWFQCKTYECLVSFKFLSMSCMGSFQWPFHSKSCYYQTKIFAGLLICVLATSWLVFQGQGIIIFSHTYSSLQSSICVQDKK